MRKSRYRRILRFFWRAMARVVLGDVILPRIGLRGLSLARRTRRMRAIASRFRALAVSMGGVLIKVGQFLSSRLDVLPRELTDELSHLQDEVGAERFEDIKALIESEYGAPLDERFIEFDPAPVASASIGQVHRARVRQSISSDPDSTVVVKVQRPRIREIVEADLAAIRVVGGWVNRFASVRKRINVHALIDEFSRALYEELDYLQEGRNAERFAANFAKRRDVLVPRVIWSHTTRRVLTLEDVGAIKITDYEAIERAGVNRRQVARRLADAYLKQVFEDGFFHADPHPGNLFVLKAPTSASPGAWRLVFVDFGMTGTLTPETFAGLRDALVAVATRDAGRLVAAYRALKLLLPGADLELIERASRRMLDEMWGKTTRDLQEVSGEEIRAFVEEFSELLYDMPFQLPENLIMLGRCLGILSGMASGLDPEFSIWEVITPYARKLLTADARGRARLAFGEVASVLRLLASLPKRLESMLTRIEDGRIDVRMPEMRQHVARLERGLRKLGVSVVLAGLLISATLLFLGGKLWEAVIFAGIGVAVLAWLGFGR